MRRLFAFTPFLLFFFSAVLAAQTNYAPCKPKIAHGTATKDPASGQYRLACDFGYVLSGNATATCTVTAAGGEQWSQKLGSCLPTCVVPSVTKGKVLDSSGAPAAARVPLGSNVVVRCDPGYAPSGNVNNSCLGTDTSTHWASPFPTCTAIGASQPSAPAGPATQVACPPSLQITQADFTTSVGTLKYSPADWRLSAGAALSLTLQLQSANVDNGQFLNCGYGSRNGLASLLKPVSSFGSRCVVASDGISFNCYK